VKVFNGDSNIYNDKASSVLDLNRRIIFVNDGDEFRRKRFAIAHELGHWILHKNILEKDESKHKVLLRKCSILQKDLPCLEKEANCFAANLLVPKNFLDKFQKMRNSELATIFMVPAEIIIYQRENKDEIMDTQQKEPSKISLANCCAGNN
jgi:Zn-dependent peptidase ImmA (M78 family)